MAAQKGKDLLLKIDSDGEGNFATVAGLRTKRLAFNSETVDITDADSAAHCHSPRAAWCRLRAAGWCRRPPISRCRADAWA